MRRWRPPLAVLASAVIALAMLAPAACASRAPTHQARTPDKQENDHHLRSAIGATVVLMALGGGLVIVAHLELSRRRDRSGHSAGSD